MKKTWATSPHLEAEYLEIEVSASLGVLIIQESELEVPRIVFCSLFPEPEKAFYEATNVYDHGLTIEEAERLLIEVRQALDGRPFRK
jgi:hypothetical protein